MKCQIYEKCPALFAMIYERNLHVHLFMWHLICLRGCWAIECVFHYYFQCWNSPKISSSNRRLEYWKSTCFSFANVIQNEWFQWFTSDGCRNGSQSGNGEYFCLLINENWTDWIIKLVVLSSIIHLADENFKSKNVCCLWFWHIMKFHTE